jgi:hypothetical protein
VIALAPCSLPSTATRPDEEEAHQWRCLTTFCQAWWRSQY